MKIYTLGTAESSRGADINARLMNLFAEFTDAAERISAFPSLKDSLVSAGKAFKENEVIMFLPDISVYGETKRLFTKAFGFKLVYDNDALSRAAATLGSCEKGSDESKIHASVPENAAILSLCDGLYAGFMISAGRQTIVFAPYEKERTMWLINEQVLPYLNRKYSLSLDASADVSFRVQRLYSALGGKTLALANTVSTCFVEAEIKTFEPLNELVKIIVKSEKRGGLPPVEYSKNITIAASELLGCDYGAAITNAFYSGEDINSEKCVYIAVANDSETRVKEIHSVANEDADGFVARCASALIDYVTQTVLADNERASAGKKTHSRKKSR